MFGWRVEDPSYGFEWEEVGCIRAERGHVMRRTVTLGRLHEPSDAVPFMRALSAHLSFPGRGAMEEQTQLGSRLLPLTIKGSRTPWRCSDARREVVDVDKGAIAALARR
jgi:hypothetical protein